MFQRAHVRLVRLVRLRLVRLRRGDGILAAKLGYNPNSSSLGVDVTFLLFGVSAIAMLTPVFSLLLRRKKPAA
ncbi:MAG: hypothetical protein ABI321_00750 [Polyangia bacterium]